MVTQSRLDHYVNLAMKHGAAKVIETLLRVIDEMNKAAEKEHPKPKRHA
jgi:molecular chaperone GrpE (heat shock protein)